MRVGGDLALAVALATPHLAQQAAPDLSAIVGEVEPAVYRLTVSSGSGEKLGTGFAVTSDGVLVANFHVIEGGASVTAKDWNGGEFKVLGVVAANKDADLALLRLRGKSFPSLTLGDSTALRDGMRVFAVGSPLGLEQTVTEGIVSSIREDDAGERYIQTTAAVSPGSSGSPLMTYDGTVVGVVRFVVQGGQNLNFAVPVEKVKALLAMKGALQKLSDLFPVQVPAPAPAPSPASGAPSGPPPPPSEMVLIPAGEFMMGSTGEEVEEVFTECSRVLPKECTRELLSGEVLRHSVYVSGFLVDKTEVTWGQYRWFAQATGRFMPPPPDWGIKDDHPVVNVLWYDAKAYCEWAGKRLPTEAEWEKAARGTAGRVYPWGNEFDCKRGNFNDDIGVGANAVPVGAACDGYAKTAPAGRFPGGKSPYGVLDMAGNVWEWCADWYGGEYYRDAPSRDPKGPSGGEERVARGGPWGFYRFFLRSSYRWRLGPSFRGVYIGFRCAQDPPK